MFHDDARVLSRVERLQAERIRPAIDETLGHLAVSEWAVPGDGEPVDLSTVPGQDFAPVELPRTWGRPWSTTFFRLEGRVPALPDGLEDSAVRLDVDLGFVDDWPGNQCEGLLLDEDLRPLKAINSRNRSTLIDETAGAALRYFVEAAANPDMMAGGTTPTELGDHLTASPEPIYQLRHARWIVRNNAVWALFHDVDVLVGLAGELPENSVRRARILCALDDAMDALDPHDVASTAQDAREVLAPVLASPAHASALSVTAIGHAHIDSAWLWPVRETIRKVARTFSNVTALMDEYPDLTFTATSAQQYEWLKETRPEVFEHVRQAVADGRWFPSGGMWVESDANMPGGEALIRQFTYGTRFFEAEFGIRSRTLWLPDSFGYSAALPQIARQMGMDGFLTQKISWNRTNQHPHSTFWWEGIDGTRLFTHFPPVNCYDSMLTADEIAEAEKNFAERGRASHQVIPFGYGDGGGGPTADMVERARRRRDLEGSPRLSMGDPDGFFETARAEYADAAPVHRGELYLEFHRGVFTSQLEMKQGNRRSEHALRTLELAWALAMTAGPGDIDQEEVDRLWKRALLLQFHDILPGSSIAWVHRDARADYEWILERTEQLTDEALTLLADGTKTASDGLAAGPAASTSSSSAVGCSLLNPGSHDRRAVVTHPDGQQHLVLAPSGAIVPLGSALIAPTSPVEVVESGDGAVVRNALLEIRVDAGGTLRQVVDLRRSRELIAPGGRGNLLQLFTDVPNEFDAWDVDRHYRTARRPRDVVATSPLRVVTSSSLRAALQVDLALGDSPARLTISLDADSAQVDMELEVDWRERETLLKVAFPLAVHARESQAEIQFGHVSRPLHENTSWDFARFEAPMHRWVLAAEPGYGIALANDSSYGYDATHWTTPGTDTATGTLLRPSLMRSPNWPDPRADLSRRTVRYSLVADADPASAAQAGDALNLPLRLVAGDTTARIVHVDDPAVSIDAILPAHDGSGDVTIRLHENRGSHVKTDLHLDVPAARVREVDPLDADVEDGDTRSRALPELLSDSSDPVRSIPLALRPFQILSLRLTPKGRP